MARLRHATGSDDVRFRGKTGSDADRSLFESKPSTHERHGSRAAVDRAHSALMPAAPIIFAHFHISGDENDPRGSCFSLLSETWHLLDSFCQSWVALFR